MSPPNLLTVLRENRTLFLIIAIGLLLVELEIFAVAVMKSGHKSWLQVYDHNGSMIHESSGQRLSDFNKYYFEKTFGPLDQYEVKLTSRDVPFPFRAWFVAALGLPIAAVLLFGFMLQAYVTLIYGPQMRHAAAPPDNAAADGGRLDRLVRQISGLNIFTIGFFVLLLLLAYWILPNLISYLGKVGVETLVRFRWVFIAGTVFMGALVVWIIYLRYLLAKKTIESQTEVEMLRLQLTHDPSRSTPLQLAYSDPPEEDPSSRGEPGAQETPAPAANDQCKS